ncbi:hypothetical protein CMV_022733 [Castanea mollissima]|uniref:F-box associated beta-propeller type 1 domain-containing protein n=1 Tax=Castanea mollissima TaxID=60419 RepID=A0A8J4QQR5_9ROSI|nr:hypothetical protein CMV_022733 [Castanea mollissima]
MRKLSVKSVMRLRFISKSLDSSITIPNFISTHLNNNNKDDDHRYLLHRPLTFSSNGLVCTITFDHMFDMISELHILNESFFNCAYLYASCNGLLCFCNYNNVIYLWNPSIRKFKKLPHTISEKFNNVALRFAYCSENNDYKVVRILFDCFFSTVPLPLPLLEAEVYSLSSDSWRRVEIPLLINICDFIFPTPLVGGALHWMADFIEGQEKHMMILSFDVNSETFRVLALPNGSNDADTNRTGLASFKGKLAFLTWGYAEKASIQCSIWMMREYGVVESWNKLFVLPFDGLPYFIAFTEYGSLLTWCMNLRVEDQALKTVLIDNKIV